MEAAVKQTTKYIIGTTLIRHRRTTKIYTCEAATIIASKITIESNRLAELILQPSVNQRPHLTS